MRLLSISTGKVLPLFASHHPNYSTVASAIEKKSISNLVSPAPIEITRLGVVGDEQADPSVHGGIEKAIYVYPMEHYVFWNELLSRETKKSVDLPLGALGENFTIEGLLENERELLGTLSEKDREVLADLLSKLVTEFDEN
mgnify:CR=1 FL=1